jgi:hypothetical protein
MKVTPTTTQLNLFVNDVDESEPLNLKIGSGIEVFAPAEAAAEATLVAPAVPEILPSDTLTDLAGIPDCEWSEFMRVHGRVPQLGDRKQPWQYRGWLLYYRLLCENHPDVVPRWDYWARTRIAGKLLDQPIPALQFETCGSHQGCKALESWLRLIDRLHSHWSPMDILLGWFLWGFGLAPEPPKISDRVNEELYRAVNIGLLLLKPYDYLGEWIANQKGKWNPHAFFPTPHSVVEFMVRMTMDASPGEDMRSKTVMEPALGSGRMLLHASNYSLRLYGVDIDPLMVKTTLVNGALYAPWMVRPFPDHYFLEAAPASSDVNIINQDALAVS